MAPLEMFTGLSGFPITPADEDGRVDTALLNGMLSRLVDAQIDSVGLLGSTGSYPYLNRSERLRAIESAIQLIGGAIPVIVGIGALRTDDAIANAKDAHKAGADGLLLAPMAYTPLTHDEVFEHFRAVAAATDLPICIYNNPTNTNFTVTVPLLKRLAKIDTILAIKNPAPARTDAAQTQAALRAVVPDNFAVGFSGDWNTPYALQAGGDAWYSVVGGLFPLPTLALCNAARAHDADKVESLMKLFQPLFDLFQECTSLRVVYAAANILGLTTTQAPRPILPLSIFDDDRVENAIAPLVNFSAGK